MSWGIRITILYLGFVALILTLVFTCFGHKTELEYKDYYARELKFQDQIDATANAVNLETPIDHQVNGSDILITVPKELLTKEFKGQVILLKPSDASKDRNVKLSPNEDGIQIIVGSGFARGVYKMQISFTSGGKNYYKESTITLK